MNEVSTVSAVAQEALVRFVQQLQDDKVSVPDSPGVGASIETPRPDVEGKKPHTHRHYDMPERARELLRDDIVNEIVLALFHMDERPAAFASLWKNQSSPSRDATGHQEVSQQLYTVENVKLRDSCRTPLLSFHTFSTILWSPHPSILQTSLMSSRGYLWA